MRPCRWPRLQDGTAQGLSLPRRAAGAPWATRPGVWRAGLPSGPCAQPPTAPVRAAGGRRAGCEADGLSQSPQGSTAAVRKLAPGVWTAGAQGLHPKVPPLRLRVSWWVVLFCQLLFLCPSVCSPDFAVQSGGGSDEAHWFPDAGGLGSPAAHGPRVGPVQSRVSAAWVRAGAWEAPSDAKAMDSLAEGGRRPRAPGGPTGQAALDCPPAPIAGGPSPAGLWAGRLPRGGTSAPGHSGDCAKHAHKGFLPFTQATQLFLVPKFKRPGKPADSWRDEVAVPRCQARPDHGVRTGGLCTGPSRWSATRCHPQNQPPFVTLLPKKRTL